MPNKYSHSVVLATYSSRGLINLPKDHYSDYVDSRPIVKNSTYENNHNVYSSDTHYHSESTQKISNPSSTAAKSVSPNKQKVLSTPIVVDETQPEISTKVYSGSQRERGSYILPKQQYEAQRADLLATLRKSKPKLQPRGDQRRRNTPHDGSALSLQEAMDVLEPARTPTTVSTTTLLPSSGLHEVPKPQHSARSHRQSRRESREILAPMVGDDKIVPSHSNSSKTPFDSSNTALPQAAKPRDHRHSKQFPTAPQTNSHSYDTGSTENHKSYGTIQAQPRPEKSLAMLSQRSNPSLHVQERVLHSKHSDSQDELPQEIDMDGFADDDDAAGFPVISGPNYDHDFSAEDQFGGDDGTIYAERGHNKDYSQSPGALPITSRSTESRDLDRPSQGARTRTITPKSRTRPKGSVSSNEGFGVPSIIRTSPRKSTPSSRNSQARALSRPTSIIPDMPRESLAAIFNPRLLDKASFSDDNLLRSMPGSSRTMNVRSSHLRALQNLSLSSLTSQDSDSEAAPAPGVALYRSDMAALPIEIESDSDAAPPAIQKSRGNGTAPSPLVQTEQSQLSQNSRGRDVGRPPAVQRTDSAPVTSSTKPRGGLFSRLRDKSLGRRT